MKSFQKNLFYLLGTLVFCLLFSMRTSAEDSRVLQNQSGFVSSLFADTSSNEETISQEKNINPKFGLAVAPEFKGTVTFEADEKQLAAMPILNGLYQLLSEAQNMHNVKQQLSSVRKSFFEYEKMKNLHEESVARLFSSIKAGRDYFTKYYGEKANGLWFGEGCYLKSTILGKKCNQITGCKKPYNPLQFKDVESHNIVCRDGVFSITDYPKMRGLLGQSISAYKLTKAETASDLNINSDNFAEAAKAETGTPVVDTSFSADLDETLNEEQLSATIGGYNSNPEKEAESEAAMREQDLVRWQIGSAAAKKVGQDMANFGSVYGAPLSIYPLWEDEKRVYDQYLKEKYKNIKLYFSSDAFAAIDFDIAKILNNTLNIRDAKVTEYSESIKKDKDRESKVKKFRSEYETAKNNLKKKNETAINAAKTKFMANLNASSKIAALKTKQENEMLQLEQKFNQSVSSLKSERQQKYNQIDEILEGLNKTKDDYQDKLSQKEDALSLAEAQDVSIELEDDKVKKDPNYVSGFKDEALKTKNDNLQIAADLEPQINTLKKKIDGEQDKIKNLRQDISGIENKIKVAQSEYIQEAVETESRHHKEMKKALENRGKNPLSPKSFLEKTVDVLLGSMMDQASALRETLKALIIQEVEKAYQDISVLPDLYNPNAYLKILERHRKMIQNIKALQAAEKATELEFVSEFVYDKKYSSAFSFGGKIKLPLSDYEGSENEDQEYFVGFEGTKRDLMAPKRMAVSYTPPLREIFHFDAVDFDAMNKYEAKGPVSYACPPFGCPSSQNPRTTKTEFLKLGQNLPDVWKRILNSGGFVERDIDIEDILTGGNVQKCEAGFIPVCSSDQVEVLSRAFLTAKGEKFVPNVGELSVIFKYDNGLTLTNAIMDLYDESVSVEDGFGGDKEPSENEIKEHAQKVQEISEQFLTRTQVGDVLQFVDTEQSYQTNLEQLKVKVDEARKSVDEVIQKLDCQYTKKDTDYLRPGEEKTRIVSSEFLADDETFEAISSCLDSGKNKYIQAALDLQKELPELSDELKQYKEKTDHMLLSLQKDNEELVVLSDDTSPSTELDEQIKSERANGEVSGRYQKESDKQMEQGQNFPTPYKADFGSGNPYVAQ